MASINANGLRPVPLLDENGVSTGKTKYKTSLLQEIAGKKGIDILLWQEGHNYDVTKDSVFFKYRHFVCKLGQCGITMLNKDMKVCKEVHGDVTPI